VGLVTHQLAVTIVVPLPSEAVRPTRDLLREYASQDPQRGALPFGKLSRVHFARLLILDNATDIGGWPLPARVVFISDIDAPLEAYLRELVETAAGAMDQIFGSSADYPTSRPVARKELIGFLQSHMVEAAANYVNTVGRSAEQIRSEEELRRELEKYLDSPDRDLSRMGSLELHARIGAHVRSREDLRWTSGPAAGPDLHFKVGETLHSIWVPLVLIILLPLLLVALPVWLVLVRTHELRDVPSNAKPDERRAQQLAALEDHVAQNQFSAVGYVKPGMLRRMTLSSILWVVDYATRHVFNRGRLAGVKTIHFARWVFLDDKRRLLFVSNYDGSLESYMDDFIDKVAWGLNAVFSNGVGYPSTRWLVLDGARREQEFKSYLRVHQQPTELWYSAYSQLTAENIANNAAIRAGLHARLSEEDAQAWLRRL